MRNYGRSEISETKADDVYSSARQDGMDGWDDGAYPGVGERGIS